MWDILELVGGPERGQQRQQRQHRGAPHGSDITHCTTHTAPSSSNCTATPQPWRSGLARREAASTRHRALPPRAAAAPAPRPGAALPLRTNHTPNNAAYYLLQTFIRGGYGQRPSRCERYSPRMRFIPLPSYNKRY